ncbi:hypothetical protein EV361DRAFT_957315 [Lentinula raphanica]|nr:hypothetical protein EV361DRAFT_957315 [Lentinula raphanica]
MSTKVDSATFHSRHNRSSTHVAAHNELPILKEHFEFQGLSSSAAEEAAEAECHRKVWEEKKRKAEDEKANKAKKTKVANSSQGPSSEQL